MLITNNLKYNNDIYSIKLLFNRQYELLFTIFALYN